MRVENYRSQGGVLSRLATLSGVAGFRRVIGRQTGAPLSEPLLYGVAGGVGLSYTTRRDPSGKVRPHLELGPRYRGSVADGLQGMCVRLGLPVSFRHTGSREVAERGLRSALERGEPIIAFVAADKLPYLASPGAWAEEPVRAVVLIGVMGTGDDETVLVADLNKDPIEVPMADFRAAWSALPGIQHLMATVDAPAAAVDLPKAIEAGLRTCCERLIDPPHPRQDFGLASVGRLARALGSGADPDTWRALLPDPADVYVALRDLFVSIELGDAGPRGGRVLFATFLGEAAEVLQGPELTDSIRSYERLGSAWRALATAALPSEVAPLADLRELLIARAALVRDPPAEAAASLAELRCQIQELDEANRRSAPLDAAGIARIFEDLNARLLRIASDEEAAISALKLALR